MQETTTPEPESRDLFAAGDGWSWACALCGIQRATSYLARPPQLDTRTENVIDRFVPYSGLGILILVACTLMIAGMLYHRWRVLEVIGHILCASLYVLISTSVVLAALFLGQPWAGSGAVAFIAAVHMSRVKALTRGGTRR
jgi:hypothetical protein